MKYTAVHYDIRIVMEMLQSTITQMRTNQRFILIEGLCNSSKLASEDDKLSLRFMDELFAIEKYLGSINSVVSFTFQKEEVPEAASVQYEEFEEEVVVEKPKKYDEEGNVIPDEGEEPAEEEGEKKKAPFNPKEFVGEGKPGWTISNKKSKNILTLFAQMKGGKAFDDFRDADNFSKQHY